jgi:hypothetical protein
MKTGNYIFTTLSVTALLLMIGMSPLATASDPQPFEGLASLCAIDRTTEDLITRGNGVVVEVNPVELYRIETDSDLVTGWEVTAAMYKTTKSEKVFYMGTATLTPDGYDGKDTLKDNFNLLQDGSLPAGTWEGTGDLKGVTVDYQLIPYLPDGDPAVLEQMCAEAHPYCETGVCEPMAGVWGWNISGVVYDDRDE